MDRYSCDESSVMILEERIVEAQQYANKEMKELQILSKQNPRDRTQVEPVNPVLDLFTKQSKAMKKRKRF